ncbi:MAG: 50S ribosomal protein L33 [Legionellales bacterium]|nr:50S ribosomal protein L33 [Legionellales bacterium]|tara:strand:+ start:404 stop:568 length:165 start_codon:yes stop_codon:yes gene_type:complete
MAGKKKTGRSIVLLVHKPTGESYATTAKPDAKLKLMKYSRKLRKHVLFVQKKAS